MFVEVNNLEIKKQNKGEYMVKENIWSEIAIEEKKICEIEVTPHKGTFKIKTTSIDPCSVTLCN